MSRRYLVIEAESGRLVSITDDDTKVAEAKVLTARGYEVLDVAEAEAVGVWNARLRVFEPKPAEPPGRDSLEDLAARVAALEAAGGTVRAR
jgi:hypothetical protein